MLPECPGPIIAPKESDSLLDIPAIATNVGFCLPKHADITWEEVLGGDSLRSRVPPG